MRVRDSKRLVIDTDVVQSSGDEDTTEIEEHPIKNPKQKHSLLQGA